MNTRHITFASGALLVLTLITAGSALRVSADSHWDNRRPGRAFLFRDSKARCVGDQLVVHIVEDTAVTNRENRQLDRATDNQGGFNFSGEADGGFGEQGASTDVELGANSDRSFGGTATFRSSREIEDSLSVVVTEILPSGSLVIEGRTDIVVGDEHRTMRISGVIRPIDIGPDNAITSDFITDLQLQYEGEGSDSRTMRQGWWSRRLGWLSPF